MGNFKAFTGLNRFLITGDGKFCSTCCHPQYLTECPGVVGDALCDNCASAYQLTSGEFRIDWDDDYPCIGDSGCYVSHSLNRQIDKFWGGACGSTCAWVSSDPVSVEADGWGCTSGHFSIAYAAMGGMPFPTYNPCISQAVACVEHPVSGELVWGVAIDLYAVFDGTQPITCPATGVAGVGGQWIYLSDALTVANYCPSIGLSLYSEPSITGASVTSPSSLTIT